MTFEEILAQVIAVLQHEGVSRTGRSSVGSTWMTRTSTT